MPKTTKHEEPGPWPIEIGMCIINSNMPLADGVYPTEPNFHPFVVLNKLRHKETGERYLELCMARTLHNPEKLTRISSAVEITEPCPPMDLPERRRQYMDAACILYVRENEFFKGHSEHCSVHGEKLCSHQIAVLQEAVQANRNKPWSTRKVIKDLPVRFTPRNPAVQQKTTYTTQTQTSSHEHGNDRPLPRNFTEINDKTAIKHVSSSCEAASMDY